MRFARSSLLLTIAASMAVAACVGSRMVPLAPEASAGCRTAVSVDGAPRPGLVRWTLSAGDRPRLDRWCVAVGPAVVQFDPASGPLDSTSASTDANRTTDGSRTGGSTEASSADRSTDLGSADIRWSGGRSADGRSTADAAGSIAVVTWNVHVGGGDLPAFVDSLRAGRLTGGVPVRDFVLLVQEAWRRDTVLVPSPLPARADGPRRIHEVSTSGQPVDVVDFARRSGLALVYVPSMRNGRGAAEDRGNAILSTLPLRDVQSTELPFEAQRRVAVSAVLALPSSDGRRAGCTVRVTSAHLDNRSRLERIFASLGTARVRQARGLIRTLSADSAGTVDVVGGDFNTWRGREEEVVGWMRDAFPDSPPPVKGATHEAGMHLDYLFARGGNGVLSGQRKVGSRFGSDHNPIVALVRLGGASACAAAPST